MPGMYRHQVSNFSPNLGNGQAIAASITSASVAVEPTHPEVYIFNDGAVTAFVRWGVGAQTATSADYPIPANAVRVLYKHNADTVAALTASGTSNVRVITGFGT
jgi:hypothetical protein